MSSTVQVTKSMPCPPPCGGGSGATKPCTSPRKKHVRFGSLAIDEFPLIIGDAIPSAGPPIALEYKAIRSSIMALNDFEAIRPERRQLCEMKLDLWERTRLLFKEGYDPNDIETAALTAEAVRLSRKESQKDVQSSSKSFRFWRFSIQPASIASALSQ
eukprot:scaffold25646_cov117-Cylindrotheca_fusiformis.AAC.1